MRILFTFVILQIFTTYAYSHESQNLNSSGIGEYLFKRQLNFYSVNAKDIYAATCKQPTQPNSYYRDYLLNYNDYPLVDTVVKGTALKKQSHLQVQALRNLLRYKHIDIITDCSSALCMSDAIFGYNIGAKKLYLLLRYGINTSIFASREEVSPWTEDDLELIIKSIEQLPAFIFPLNKEISFQHMARNIYNGTHAQTDPRGRGIYVYSTWDRLPTKEDKLAILTHELGHAIAAQTHTANNPTWLNFSGWQVGLNDSNHTKYKNLISKYAFENYNEDFAESLTAYRYKPSLLKALAPNKYRYMQEVIFNGVDYTTESKCEKENSYFHVVINTLPTKLENYLSCEDEIANYAILSKNYQQAISCLRTAIHKKIRNLDIQDRILNLHHKKLIIKNKQQFDFPKTNHRELDIKEISIILEQMVREFKGLD